MKLTRDIQEYVFKDVSLVGLKAAIIVIALFLIFIAVTTNNKWVLAGTLAWAILP